MYKHTVRQIICFLKNLTGKFIFKSLILITDFGVLANIIKFSLEIARGVLRRIN